MCVLANLTAQVLGVGLGKCSFYMFLFYFIKKNILVIFLPSWLGFANKDLGRTSTSSTSTLVAEEAYAGQAGPATVATGKGLV